MRTVYLLRHGLAYAREDWKDDDAQRPLTGKGMKQMVSQAKVMAEIGLGISLIISSPLTRAYQTADIVARRLKLSEELIQDERVGLGFGYEDLSAILKEHADRERILLVGHEPDMSQTISALVGGGVLNFKKGALARVDITSDEPLHGELIWLITPKWMLG